LRNSSLTLVFWNSSLTLVLVAAASFAIPAAAAEAPQALLERHSCYICHADKEARTGPAFVDIAARYRGNAQAPALLTASVRNGVRGGGPWHMPPHPEISIDDASTMVRYILSLHH